MQLTRNQPASTAPASTAPASTAPASASKDGPSSVPFRQVSSENKAVRVPGSDQILPAVPKTPINQGRVKQESPDVGGGGIFRSVQNVSGSRPNSIDNTARPQRTDGRKTATFIDSLLLSRTNPLGTSLVKQEEQPSGEQADRFQMPLVQAVEVPSNSVSPHPFISVNADLVGLTEIPAPQALEVPLDSGSHFSLVDAAQEPLFALTGTSVAQAGMLSTAEIAQMVNEIFNPATVPSAPVAFGCPTPAVPFAAADRWIVVLEEKINATNHGNTQWISEKFQKALESVNKAKTEGEQFQKALESVNKAKTEGELHRIELYLLEAKVIERAGDLYWDRSSASMNRDLITYKLTKYQKICDMISGALNAEYYQESLSQLVIKIARFVLDSFQPNPSSDKNRPISGVSRMLDFAIHFYKQAFDLVYWSKVDPKSITKLCGRNKYNFLCRAGDICKTAETMTNATTTQKDDFFSAAIIIGKGLRINDKEYLLEDVLRDHELSYRLELFAAASYLYFMKAKKPSIADHPEYEENKSYILELFVNDNEYDIRNELPSRMKLLKSIFNENVDQALAAQRNERIAKKQALQTAVKQIRQGRVRMGL